MPRLIIWGAGRLGRHVAGHWLDDGSPVVGYTLSEDRHAALREMGVEPRTGDPLQDLLPEDRLLLALPGSASQLEAVESLIGHPAPARSILISSTRYYGQPSGLVDEGTQPGEGERAVASAATEQAFRSWAGATGVVLRTGGLYDSDRGPFAALARSGDVPRGAPDRVLALVHYEDAARATFEALRYDRPEQTYLVVMPPSPTRKQFYELACRKLGLSAPAFDEPLGTEKVVYDVSLLRRDLLPVPAHRNWRGRLD